MTLDRNLQRRILECCAACYPHMTTEPGDYAPSPELVANVAYLQEHGLVQASLSTTMNRETYFAGVKATSKGMDFLAEDGGLTAILGVMTIRLHDDTIKALIAQKIQEADLPPADKRRYLDQLRELPGETTKHLVLKLVDMGLDQGPKAMEWIGKWLAS